MINRIYKFIFKREINLSKKIPISHILYLGLSMILDWVFYLIKIRRFKFSFSKYSCKFYGNKLLTVGNGVRFGQHSIINAIGINGISIGDGSKVGDFSILKVSGSLTDPGLGITIGKNVGLSEYTYIGGAGGVIIGNDVIAGQYLSIHPENHNFSDISTLIKNQGVSRKGISIGNNCWIGAKVTFLDGSKVGNNCVIAAGSIVTKQFTDNLLLGGVPARILKNLANN